MPLRPGTQAREVGLPICWPVQALGCLYLSLIAGLSHPRAERRSFRICRTLLVLGNGFLVSRLITRSEGGDARRAWFGGDVQSMGTMNRSAAGPETKDPTQALDQSCFGLPRLRQRRRRNFSFNTLPFCKIQQLQPQLLSGAGLHA